MRAMILNLSLSNFKICFLFTISSFVYSLFFKKMKLMFPILKHINMKCIAWKMLMHVCF